MQKRRIITDFSALDRSVMKNETTSDSLQKEKCLRLKMGRHEPLLLASAAICFVMTVAGAQQVDSSSLTTYGMPDLSEVPTAKSRNGGE